MAIAIHDVDTFTEQPVAKRMSRQRRIMVILFVVSFALDFKGAVGGSSVQPLMAGLNIVIFLLLVMSCRMAILSKGLAAYVFWGWSAFLVVGTIGALVNATPFGHFIRIAYPFTLFLEGFLVASWAASVPLIISFRALGGAWAWAGGTGIANLIMVFVGFFYKIPTIATRSESLKQVQ